MLQKNVIFKGKIRLKYENNGIKCAKICFKYDENQVKITEMLQKCLRK